MGACFFWVFVGSAGASLLAWFLILSILRRLNFDEDTKERRVSSPIRDEDPTLRAQSREYHNNAIYQTFEFFVKIALAILAGIAYLTVQEPQASPRTAALIQTGGYLLFLSGLILTVVIISHQKSKIERWEDRFKLLSVLTWVETWLIASMMGLGAATAWVVAPSLSS